MGFPAYSNTLEDQLICQQSGFNAIKATGLLMKKALIDWIFETPRDKNPFALEKPDILPLDTLKTPSYEEAIHTLFPQPVKPLFVGDTWVQQDNNLATGSPKQRSYKQPELGIRTIPTNRLKQTLVTYLFNHPI